MAPDRTAAPGHLLVCAPLLVEYAAVRRGGAHSATAGRALGAPPGGALRTHVLRTGMGPRRAARAAARLYRNPAARDVSTMVVAGVGGALTPALRPGDVVVASEVLAEREHAPVAGGEWFPVAGGERFPVAGAEALANSLRAAGLPVHVGPLLSTRRLAAADPAALYTRTGAIAVDMETAWLVQTLRREAGVGVAGAGAGLGVAAVRVIVDTPSSPLVNPRTVPNGVRALRALARVAAVLPWWAGAEPPGRAAPPEPPPQTPRAVRSVPHHPAGRMPGGRPVPEDGVVSTSKEVS